MSFPVRPTTLTLPPRTTEISLIPPKTSQEANFSIAIVDIFRKKPNKDFTHGIVVRDIIQQFLPNAKIAVFGAPRHANKKQQSPQQTCKAIHTLYTAILNGKHYDAVNISMADFITLKIDCWKMLKIFGGDIELLRIYYLGLLEDEKTRHPDAPLSKIDGEYETVGDVVNAIYELEEIAKVSEVFVAAGNINHDKRKIKARPKRELNVFTLAKGVHVVGALEADNLNHWQGSDNHPEGSMNNPFIDHWGQSKIRVNDGSYTVDEKGKRHRIKRNGHGSYMSEHGTSYTTPFIVTQHLLSHGQGPCPYEFPPSEFFKLYLQAQPKRAWATHTDQSQLELVS